jgi:hypothetical protein
LSTGRPYDAVSARQRNIRYLTYSSHERLEIPRPTGNKRPSIVSARRSLKGNRPTPKPPISAHMGDHPSGQAAPIAGQDCCHRANSRTQRCSGNWYSRHSHLGTVHLCSSLCSLRGWPHSVQRCLPPSMTGWDFIRNHPRRPCRTRTASSGVRNRSAEASRCSSLDRDALVLLYV